MQRCREIDVAERRAVKPPVIGVPRAIAAVVIEPPPLSLPVGERRAGIGRRIGIVERHGEARAVAVAPFVEQLGVDMLARVEPRPAPIVGADVGVGHERLEPGPTDRAGIDPHEGAPRGVRAEREIDERLRARLGIVERQRQQPPRPADGRRVEIDRTLRERDLLEILGIGELRGIGVIIADVVLRRAFEQHADLVLPEPAQRQARAGRQAVGVARRDVRAGQQADELERVERGRLLGDEIGRDRALRLGRVLVGQQAFGIGMAGDDDIAGRVLVLGERRDREHRARQQREAERAARDAVGRGKPACHPSSLLHGGVTESAASPPYAGINRIRFSGSWAAAHLSAAH